MPYESWRTVDAPLTESRIRAMESGDPVHLILWPNTTPGTRYVIEPGGRCYLSLIGKRDTADGYREWKFLDHHGATWIALTKPDHAAHVATLTRKNLI